MHVDVNGTRLWFDIEGPSLVPDGPQMRRRPTIILLHGGPGSYDHSYFKPDFGRLAEVAQVVYLDLRDHGRSSRGDPAEWTFEACADDIPAFCDALGIEHPVVLGHSMGGFVAIHYGARHPQHAAGLVLLSTLARFDLELLADGVRAAAGEEVAEIARRSYGGLGEVTAAEWARVFRVFGPAVPGADEQARKVVNQALNPPGMDLLRRLDILHQLPRLESPTLVCVGELDPVTPVAAARQIVDHMPAGLARLEVLPGAGHFPWKDNPDALWPLLSAFITS